MSGITIRCISGQVALVLAGSSIKTVVHVRVEPYSCMSCVRVLATLVPVPLINSSVLASRRVVSTVQLYSYSRTAYRYGTFDYRSIVLYMIMYTVE